MSTQIDITLEELNFADIIVTESGDMSVELTETPAAISVEMVNSVPGERGPEGTNILRGTGAPSAGTGVDGDSYIDDATLTLYGPKSGGTWGSGQLLQGTDGTDGNTLLRGTGAPSAGTGVDGDSYIDDATLTLYGPKSGGTWGSGQLLQGTDGTDGNTLLRGTGAPSAGTGVDGDSYIDDATLTLYGPKSGGAWGSGTQLEGTDGQNGISINQFDFYYPDEDAASDADSFARIYVPAPVNGKIVDSCAGFHAAASAGATGNTVMRLVRDRSGTETDMATVTIAAQSGAVVTASLGSVAARTLATGDFILFYLDSIPSGGTPPKGGAITYTFQ